MGGGGGRSEYFDTDESRAQERERGSEERGWDGRGRWDGKKRQGGGEWGGRLGIWKWERGMRRKRTGGRGGWEGASMRHALCQIKLSLLNQPFTHTYKQPHPHPQIFQNRLTFHVALVLPTTSQADSLFVACRA